MYVGISLHGVLVMGLLACCLGMVFCGGVCVCLASFFAGWNFAFDLESFVGGV